MTKALQVRGLNAGHYPLNEWEETMPDFESARVKAFNDAAACGFAIDEEDFYYFGTVVPTAEFMKMRAKSIGSDALVERYTKDALAQGITHYVIDRHGGYGPLTDRTSVLDTKTGRAFLWPPQPN